VSHFQLYVGKEDTVSEIQHKFSEIFPHLQLSIFRHTGDFGSASTQDILYTPETRMNKINPELRADKLEMDSRMTVAAFESVFFNQFGLFVQVSRINQELETEKFKIDHFPLDEANYAHGSELPGKKIIPFRDLPFGC
jgi:hypothetical protein